MDNMSVHMLMPNAKDIKVNKLSTKAPAESKVDNKTAFDSRLLKAVTKEVKLSKSIMNENAKDIPVNKPVEIKTVNKEENIEAVYAIIMTLVNNILEVPMEDIEAVMKEMNISPMDLLKTETFNEFLTHVYPGYDEQHLLLNEEKVKDISKLFVKLEQVSEMLAGEQSHILIEKWVLHDEVVKTNITEIAVQPASDNEQELEPVNTQVMTQNLQAKDLVNVGKVEDDVAEETIPDGHLSDEGMLNFKQMGLGLNVPIQAFGHTPGTKLWDAQGVHTHTSGFEGHESITRQMINKLDISSSGGTREITMELSPRELGNLSIKLVESSGVLVAHIKVENERTKELLLNEMAQFKQAIEEQGLSISEVKVDIKQNSHQSQMEKEKQKSAKRIQALVDKHLIEIPDDTVQHDERIGELTETEVDYMV